jgi:hypothetical protein
MTTKNKKESKTDTIIQRTINVYMPTFEMKEKWKKLADAANQSISKFVIEHVTNSLNHEKENPSIETRIQLIKDKKQLQEENRELLKQIKDKEKLAEIYEKEARSHSIKPFLEQDFSGIRKFEKDLIELFKKDIEVRKEEIYKKLHIDILETDAVTAVQKQIEILERYGLLKDIGGVWRWKG